jgi:serine protease SohB
MEHRVSTFFFEYGLFAAKMITILAITLAAIAGCIILFSTRQQEKESIQIEKINDKFDNMRDALEETLLSKDEYKALKKDRKKEDKAEEKRIKIQLKKGEQESLRPRLFVLRFDGDMHASEVDSLREAITAILLVAKKEDEVLTNPRQWRRSCSQLWLGSFRTPSHSTTQYPFSSFYRPGCRQWRLYDGCGCE